ncbi:MAG: hypothetical protein V1775_08160 [Bacteroidota bacterium]
MISLCLVFGAGLAVVLYYRNTSDDFSRALIWFLSLFRFLAGSFIAFLLLSPMVKTMVRTTEKPAIVLAIDNSRSMLLCPDSNFVRNELQKRINELGAQLGSEYNLIKFTFGEKARPGDSIDFSGKLTDIADFFNGINNRFYNRNLGAVVMASDGIYNAGSDPSYLVRDVSYPVFTINIGDTNQHRDLMVKRVNFNRLAYKGNRFPIEILIQAYESAGESSRLKVMQKGTEIFSQDLRFISDKQMITIPITALATETGKLRFHISIDPIGGETNESNNTREIIIEVKDGRQKVAIIGNSPHPDLAAIERAIGNSNNFETDLFFAEDFTGNPSDYSLFILHQLPSVSNQVSKLLNDLKSLNIPALYILGNQSDINTFNSLNNGLSLSGFNNTFNESLPLFNNNFPLFISSESLKQLIQTVPPLTTPFAKYKPGNAVYVYANQSVGTSATTMPLIFFNQNPDRRIGVIAGEGLWRWRLTDFSKNSNFVAFDELIGKIVQYLAVKTEKSRFRVSARDYYAENENIEFGAILFNESFELVNDKLVTMVIAGEDGKKYEFEFTSSGESYLLDAGNFAPGIYTYEASVETGTGTLKQPGSFVINALNLEDINTVANHRLLNSLAKLTGGEGITPDKISGLAELIKSRKDVKPVTYVRKRYTDLISFIPLLFIIISLLSLEWFLRKFNGSY